MEKTKENKSKENNYKKIAGCKDRNEYLEQVSENTGMDLYAVKQIAFMLGEDEDFDGLVSLCEDFGGMF